jgi:hypothetical protein
MTHNFSKMFLRARPALEFSHGLDPKLTFVGFAARLWLPGNPAVGYRLRHMGNIG